MKKSISVFMSILLFAGASSIIYYGCKKKDSNTSSSSSSTTTTPTCSDGIQNQGETGIDCGGPCTACVCNPGTYTCGGSFPTCLAGTYCAQDNCPTSQSFQSPITASGVTISIANFSNGGAAVKLGATWDGPGTTSLTIGNQQPWANDVSVVSGTGTIDTTGKKMKITLNYSIQYGSHNGTCVSTFSKK